jgi:hypothetical protein
MLTTQVGPTTFVVGSQTFEVGDRIPLEGAEVKMLAECVEFAGRMLTGKDGLLQRVYDATGSFDAKLASDFYAWEDVKFKHSTTATLLLRTITRRLGGVLPLHLLTAAEDPHVVVRGLTGPDDQVILNLDIIASGTQFSGIAADMRTAALSFLGGDPKESLKKTRCSVASWTGFGAPYVDVDTKELGETTSLEYAKDFLSFSWSDHQDHGLDRLTVSALGSIMDTPNRLNSLRSGQAPLPMLAMVFGPETTRIVNLTQVMSGQERDRLPQLQSAVEAVSADAISLLQFGELNNAGSKVDTEQYQQAQGRPYGFSETLVIRTEAGTIIGAKSWVLHQQQGQQPSLQTYGVFEDNAGLPDPKGTEALQRILARTAPSTDSVEGAVAVEAEEAVSASS